MRKLTQKQLKALINIGAVDITTMDEKELKTLKKQKSIKQVGYSKGVYGCNGMLLKDDEGNTYVITSRASNLWLF